MNRAAALIAVVIVLLLLPSASGADATVFYIVRHAEKEPGNGDVALTAAGKERAKELAAMMKTLRVSVIYTTPAVRAVQTATPTAEAVQQNLVKYEYNPQWLAKLGVEHKGKSVLIVGHAPTIHEIAGSLAASPPQAGGDV